MKKGRNEKDYSFSLIRAGATLLTSLESVSANLNKYPDLVRLKSKKLRYLVSSDDKSDHFYTFEFDKDSIIVTIGSIAIPVYFIDEALLRLFGVASYLNTDYMLEMRSLYPYMIEVLAKARLQQYRVPIEKKALVEEDNNMIFARRINSLADENARLKSENQELATKLNHTLSKLVILGYGYDSDIDMMAKENGISKNDLLIVLNNMESLGYKVMFLGRGKFRLVKM